MNLRKVTRGVGRDELADACCGNVLCTLVGTFRALEQRHPERLRVVLELSSRCVRRDFLQRLKGK